MTDRRRETIAQTLWGVDAASVYKCADAIVEALDKLAETDHEAALPWEDVHDEWTKEIRAAFPTSSGSHDEYATAMRMVGNRRSKTELVALVNWLLVTRRESAETLAARIVVRVTYWRGRQEEGRYKGTPWREARDIADELEGLLDGPGAQ